MWIVCGPGRPGYRGIIRSEGYSSDPVRLESVATWVGGPVRSSDDGLA